MRKAIIRAGALWAFAGASGAPFFFLLGYELVELPALLTAAVVFFGMWQQYTQVRHRINFQNWDSENWFVAVCGAVMLPLITVVLAYVHTMGYRYPPIWLMVTLFVLGLCISMGATIGFMHALSKISFNRRFSM